MSDFVGFLEGAEKLAYKILVWIILIPKTLWHTIVNPGWVPGYINKELSHEKSAFDEYVSPIILLLVVALVPTLIIFILPDLDLGISSPAESEPSIQRHVKFEAEATFISASNNMRDQYTWYVEMIETDGAGGVSYDEYGYPKYFEIYREMYDELTDTTTITFNGNTEQSQEYLHQQNTSLTRSRNSSFDTFSFLFDVPGLYFVNVEVIRFDSNRQDISVEEYGGSTYMYVVVPVNPEEPISIKNYAPKIQPKEWEDVFSEKFAIVIALALLTPPLLLAFAVRVLTREKISEHSLRENFYIQCYYFSPLSLTFWATFYGLYFYTIDVFSYNYIYGLTLFLPLTWAVLWFVQAESFAIGAILKASIWEAFIVVIECMYLIIGLAIISIYLVFFDQTDSLRKGLIWAYPFIFHLTLLGLILFRIFSWLAGLTKLSTGDVILFGLFLASIFFFIGGNLLGTIAVPDSPAPTVVSSSLVPITGYDVPVSLPPTAAPVNPVATTTLMILPISGINPRTYVMHRGEFPYCIARRFNVHPAELLTTNGLTDGQGLSQGATLSIPQNGSHFPGNRALQSHPTTYTVVSSNETLYSVACQFGDVDPAAIAYMNGISIDTTLSTGQQLQIP